MHCFASENQTYTGTWLFGVESWKSLKGQENLLLKNLQVNTRVENVRFLSWRIFFVGKYGIQSTNEMAFKRTVTLRASFRFSAIRFDASTLLSFSRFTHAHAKCPPVGALCAIWKWWIMDWIISIYGNFCFLFWRHLEIQLLKCSGLAVNISNFDSFRFDVKPRRRVASFDNARYFIQLCLSLLKCINGIKYEH